MHDFLGFHVVAEHFAVLVREKRLPQFAALELIDQDLLRNRQVKFASRFGAPQRHAVQNVLPQRVFQVGDLRCARERLDLDGDFARPLFGD